MKFFGTKLTGDLIQRIECLRRAERFLTSQTLNLLSSVFTFIVFGVVLFYSEFIFIKKSYQILMGFFDDLHLTYYFYLNFFEKRVLKISTLRFYGTNMVYL